MDLIDELKNLRTRKGVSQAAVAEATGCDQSTVSLWEQRKGNPSGSARILLAAFIERMRALPDKSVAA